jgi:transcription antitermination protein NusB
MLSRRNIRIKVMQMLYAMSRDPESTFDDVLKNYRESIQNSFELYLYNLQYIISVAKYALKDAEKRAKKHLPSEEDKIFTPKLFNNDFVQAIVLNADFIELVKEYELDKMIDADSVRSFYNDFAKKGEYKKYLEKDNTQEDDQKILLDLFKTLIAKETYNETMEDKYPLWGDDKSLIIGTIKKTIKALPDSIDFCETYKPQHETTIEFGEALLKNVQNNDASLLEIIEPTLQNWDADRVAIIDMISLKMALSELMIFPTIPTKVTINEFVEISKMYSTEKSKDFVNGVLDRLMKKLDKEGKIKKSGRGLLD